MKSSSPKKRILFLISEDWYFWSHRRNIAAAAKQQGYDVWLATRVDKLGKEIREDGIHLVELRWFRRRSQSIVREMRALMELVQVVRRIRPHILHQVALKTVLMGTLAVQLSHKPNKMVNALGGLGVLFSKRDVKISIRQRVLLFVLRMLNCMSPAVWILQNASDRQTLVDANIARRANTFVIPGSGVDPFVFKPQGEIPGPPTVLLASRLIWPKGIEEFIRAAGRIRRRGITARFAIAGSRDAENPHCIPDRYLKRWVANGTVEYWGHIRDMPSALRSVHIFCLPTYYGEGVPKALIEAAACGLPAVTTKIPGCTDIIHHGINGFTVPPKDVNTLVEALTTLITDDRLRRAMKPQARRIFLEHFTDAHIQAAILRVWETSDAIAGNRPFDVVAS